MIKVEAQAAMIEKIVAEYYNETYIILPEYSFYRVSSEGIRHYVQVFPDESTTVRAGITSILHREIPTSSTLIKWYGEHGYDYCKWFVEQSGNYGTWFHVLAGRLLRQEEVSLDINWIMTDIEEFTKKKSIEYRELYRWIHDTYRDPRKDIYGFLAWSADYKPEPLAMEYPLSNPEGGYACTLDCVAYITPPEGGRHLAMIDWKTGKESYESHELQLHAQERAWNIEYPDKKIERIYNWFPHDFRMPLKKTVTPYKFIDQTDSDNLWKLDHYIALFHGSAPKIKSYTDFKCTITTIGQELDLFEEIDPIKKILEL